MAGHSKWANTQHRKSAQDSKRAKIFTRIMKEISMAIKQAGPELENNPKLRNAIANAKGANIPKENIERAIKKASGAEGANYQELNFEGYGPYGIAIFIECLSDNSIRTTANVRAILSKAAGNLAKSGEVAFFFERKGVFYIEKSVVHISMEDFELEMIDAGAQELQIEEENVIVYSNFKEFGQIQFQLERLQINPTSASLERIPIQTKTLEESEAKAIVALVDKLEADRDVENVYHNLQILN